MSPASFKPLEPDDLIGSAGVAARALVAKARRVRCGGDGKIKVVPRRDNHEESRVFNFTIIVG